jgi:hypothetical protein
MTNTLNEAAPVTLEITVAPVDWPHAVHVLPHQLRQWAGQVEDIQFTLDLHTSRGRYGAAAQERRAPLITLLAELCAEYPHAHVCEVDYAPQAAAQVSERFFGGRDIPPKHHYGGPVYSYFFGWHMAKHDHVFHMDSDLLFGGGGQRWVAEAVRVLAARPEILLCSPLPGPPTDDGDFPEHVRAGHTPDDGPGPRREHYPSIAYRFSGCSTRLFLFDRARFIERLAPLPLVHPRLRSHLRALVEGHPPYELPERTITRQMLRCGLGRFDFLGEPPGMWSLHPALRSDLFHQELPRIISDIERGDLPVGQRGDFELNDSMIDWTSAREAKRSLVWWKRIARQLTARLRT